MTRPITRRGLPGHPFPGASSEDLRRTDVLEELTDRSWGFWPLSREIGEARGTDLSGDHGSPWTGWPLFFQDTKPPVISFAPRDAGSLLRTACWQR